MRFSLLFALLLAGSPLLANDNTHPKHLLRVELKEGRAQVGPVKLKDAKLQIRSKKLRYDAIKAIEDAYPPSAAYRAELRVTYEKRRAKASTPKAWASLGAWAWKRGLDPEARAAWAAALKLDPNHGESRAGLGQRKVGEAWVDARPSIARKRALLEPGDAKGLLALAKEAQRHGAHEAAFRLLSEILLKRFRHKGALKRLRPLTSRHVQKTRLRLPVRGRWKAHEDPTRHHQKGSVSIYALDLVKIEDGFHCVGRGRNLKDHYAFGQPFYAAAAGTVYHVVDGKPDLPIGVQGKASDNNMVGIDHGNGEFTWYAHATPGSIQVKQGQRVEQGQLLGKVGNSGKSVIPHLHFALTRSTWVSLPWACDDYLLIAPDGSKLPVKRACPREGWVFESKPQPKPAPANDD